MQNSSALRSWCSLWYSDIQSSDNTDIFLACCTYFPSGKFLVVYRYGPQEKSHYKKEINGWPFSIGLHIIGDGSGCLPSCQYNLTFAQFWKWFEKSFWVCVSFSFPLPTVWNPGVRKCSTLPPPNRHWYESHGPLYKAANLSIGNKSCQDA